MNPGGEGCGELRSHHCTPAWVTRKKKKRIVLLIGEATALPELWSLSLPAFPSFSCLLEAYARGQRTGSVVEDLNDILFSVKRNFSNCHLAGSLARDGVWGLTLGAQPSQGPLIFGPHTFSLG